MTRKRNAVSIAGYIVTAAIFILIAMIAAQGLGEANDTSRSEQIKALEDSVRRVIVTCYAMEGVYPESVDYMRENYGLQFDEKTFTVHYEIFASNIMPSFTVVRNSGIRMVDFFV